ncbi:ATP-binding protein [Actinacidiphila sp. ITFR-21]|uniref:ATP-binding protein n=1 Tax=Actinacidiphila sp. ITFR-21 TaxID=3075199 RepID=UPI00288B2235|nr:ATP-binding protein [Streptomyces sp. ITFR-21]WNI14705.1 ATP-binding protein [Streptomyces sp. ITFR-21]
MLTPASRLTLAVVPSAARDARDFVALVLRHWQLDALSDAATLVVSGLVTNALRAATDAGPDMLLGDPFGESGLSTQVIVQPDAVRLSVRDPSPRLPHLGTPDSNAEHGRGLLLVQMLTSRWGVYRLPKGGKVVWAELATPATTSVPYDDSHVGLAG